MKLVAIDSYGTCEHNAVFDELDTGRENATDHEAHLERKRLRPTNYYERKLKRTRRKQYPFVLAAENSDLDGYITEKIVHAYDSGAIPIYWGARDASKYFGPHLPMIDVRSLIEDDDDEDDDVRVDEEEVITNESCAATTHQRVRGTRKKLDTIARAIFDAITSIIEDPEDMTRRWRRTFGRGHLNSYSRSSPMISQCIHLREHGVAFPSNSQGLSQSMHDMRARIDHSDMFSIDEMICATCAAAYSASARFEYAGCYEYTWEQDDQHPKATSTIMDWNPHRLQWDECRHRALILGQPHFFMSAVRPQELMGEDLTPQEIADTSQGWWCGHLRKQHHVSLTSLDSVLRRQLGDTACDMFVASSSDDESHTRVRMSKHIGRVAAFTVSRLYEYVGCFEVLTSWSTIEGTRRANGRGRTWSECRSIALSSSSLWFAMTSPRQYNKDGEASCGVGGVYKLDGRVDDQLCRDEVDEEGHLLGGSVAMAVYQTPKPSRAQQPGGSH